VNIVPALMILSAHKNCDKSVLHVNLEEILMSKEATKQWTSKKFTRNMSTYTREKKIQEARSCSGREKVITEVSKEVRKMTC